MALSYDSKLAKAYMFRGVYYEGIGDFEQAIEEYNKALEYDPDDKKAIRGLRLLNDFDEVIF